MCEYCNGDAERIAKEEHHCFDKSIVADIWISAWDKEIYSMLDDVTIARTKIKYCPMCGRKLNTD